jgi:hypothetical protein
MLPTKPIADLLKRALGEPVSLPEKCWARNFLQRLDREVVPNDRAAIAICLSDAMAMVEATGQDDYLIKRVKDAHPVDKAHDQQYDGRLRDCFTEACALAWASCAGLRNPRWVLGEGKPDLRTEDCWIEAKTIHASDNDQALTERMLKKDVVSGSLTSPGGGLIRKFQADLEDALEKFKRVEAGRTLVFYNLEQLDLLALPFEDALRQDLYKWSRDACSQGVEVVICQSYNWRSPVEWCVP